MWEGACWRARLEQQQPVEADTRHVSERAAYSDVLVSAGKPKTVNVKLVMGQWVAGFGWKRVRLPSSQVVSWVINQTGGPKAARCPTLAALAALAVSPSVFLCLLQTPLVGLWMRWTSYGRNCGRRMPRY